MTFYCCHLTEEMWSLAKILGALLEKESRHESKEAKMCRRKKGADCWSDTAWFWESHGEVNCGGNQNEELGWFACSSPWSMDLSIAGLVQSSFWKFEVVLLQLLLLSKESVTSQVGFGNCSVRFWGGSSASRRHQEDDTHF